MASRRETEAFGTSAATHLPQTLSARHLRRNGPRAITLGNTSKLNEAEKIKQLTYLSRPFAAEHWSKLNGAERNLSLNAELAMELATERLRRLGYEVVLVPSSFPRLPANGYAYYPSMPNALVRTGTGGFQPVRP